MNRESSMVRKLRSNLRKARRRIRLLEMESFLKSRALRLAHQTIFENDVENGLYDYARGM